MLQWLSITSAPERISGVICPDGFFSTHPQTDGQIVTHRGVEKIKKYKKNRKGGERVERLARGTPEQVHVDGKVCSYMRACTRRLVWSLSGTKFIPNLKVACLGCVQYFFDRCHEC